MGERTAISIDGMGGDRAPEIVVEGLERFAAQRSDLHFLLHGDEVRLKPLLQQAPTAAPRTEIRHTTQIVAMDAKPSQAIRRGKGTSMWNAIDAVKSGEAIAAVSAGNTGVLMGMSLLVLRTLPGLRRPALVAAWPTRKGVSAVLDLGADIHADAEQLVEFAINCLILAGLMVWYEMVPMIYILWAPVIILYTLLVALTLAFFGAAINVYYRDVGQALPVILSLLMYASPVIYPLKLVKEKLLEQRAAGEWSELLYTLYTANPLAGIIDAFQNVVLRGQPPDFSAMIPGAIGMTILLPLSYRYFKRAEANFADVI